MAAPSHAAVHTEQPSNIYAALVVDNDSGRVLYRDNAKARRHPASLTKMMTLYLVFEALEDGRLNLGMPLAVSVHAASMEPSKLGIPAGGSVTVKDAILSIVTKSANDMAVVLAEAIAGSESKFADLMNAKAAELGMTLSHFRNASGLTAPNHYSTARDLLILARALISRFPKNYRLFSTGSFRYANKSYPNMNTFLKTYAGADGVKTGYTKAAGHCLAASAVRGGHRIVGVVLGGPSLAWTRRHMTMLVDQAFNSRPSSPSVVVASTNKAEAEHPRVDAYINQRFSEPTSNVSTNAGKKTERAAPIEKPEARVTNSSVTRAPTRAPTQQLPRVAATVQPSPNRAASPLPQAIDASPAQGLGTPKFPEHERRDNQPVYVAGSGSRPPKGRWQVRIGTYKNLSVARRRADRAIDLLPPSIAGSRLRLAHGHGGVVVSAVELIENDARELCSSLQRGGLACIVTPPDRQMYITRR